MAIARIAAARFNFGDRFVVEQRNAIPEQISVGRLEQKRALANGKFRFRADTEKVRRFLLKPVVVTTL